MRPKWALLLEVALDLDRALCPARIAQIRRSADIVTIGNDSGGPITLFEY